MIFASAIALELAVLLQAPEVFQALPAQRVYYYRWLYNYRRSFNLTFVARGTDTARAT